MSVNIVLEKGPETPTDVLVNVFCDGKRAGTLALSKETWTEMWTRGSFEVYVASAFEGEGPDV